MFLLRDRSAMIAIPTGLTQHYHYHRLSTDYKQFNTKSTTNNLSHIQF